MAAHLPIASFHHENRSVCPSRPEENLQKPPRFAHLRHTCTFVEDKTRGSTIVCHAKMQKQRMYPLAQNPDDVEMFRGTLHRDDMCGNRGFLIYRKCTNRPNRMVCHGNKKIKGWQDLFNYGEDPEMINGRQFADDGLQDPEFPDFPHDPSNEYGFLNFPAKFNVELASLPVMARKDVRSCCCLVSGGVYENLLFFPVIQLLKDRYPGVFIDVVATDRGKQTYEINKNVKRAWVYDVDAHFVAPSEYIEFVGKIKNEYYEMLVSTRISGAGHSLTLFLTSSRDKIAYVYPNVNAAGAGIFLSDYVVSPRLNLSEGGYHMYAELVELLKNPKPNVPLINVQPLQVGISKRVRNVVQEKYTKVEVSKGEFLVFHGIESTSKASMQSKGDPDSLLPLKLWAEIAQATSVKWVVVVPMESDRNRVYEVLGEESKIVFITTPGQLAGLINDSLGVVTTNTAAVQLACALKKPSVALFSSKEKADLFVPHAKEGRCMVVASATGKLADVDVKTAIKAMKTVEEEMMVAA